MPPEHPRMPRNEDASEKNTGKRVATAVDAETTECHGAISSVIFFRAEAPSPGIPPRPCEATSWTATSPDPVDHRNKQE